jgi:prepilin-type N-terminal cleavage/methylation domain-containing protein
MKLNLPSRKFRSALTMPEMLVTIAVMGVIVGVSIPIYSNLTEGSRETAATDLTETLNRAVIKFSQNCWRISTPADAAATTDEFLVLRSLQYTFPAAQMRIGAPYYDARYNPTASSNSQDIRLRWNGTSFELLKPGTAGTGLRYNGAADYTSAPYAFPSDYAPVAAVAN